MEIKVKTAPCRDLREKLTATVIVSQEVMDTSDKEEPPKVPTPPEPIDASKLPIKFACRNKKFAKFETRRSIIGRILKTFKKERDVSAGTK